MATLVTDNAALFRCDPATGNPDAYEWVITDGHNVHPPRLTGGPWFYVTHWETDDDLEVVVSARAARTNDLGQVVEVGPWSEPSDPIKIQPVPEPYLTTLLFWGVALLWVLYVRARWGRRRQ